MFWEGHSFLHYKNERHNLSPSVLYIFSPTRGSRAFIRLKEAHDFSSNIKYYDLK